MDPAPIGSPRTNPDNDLSDASASDNEDEPPEEFDSSALSFIDQSAVAEVRGIDNFWNSNWRFNETIQKARFMWFSFKRRCVYKFARQGRGDDPYSSRQGNTTFTEQLRTMLFSSWLNVLLIFVPLGAVTFAAKMNPLLVFTCNAMAIVPLSSLLTEATERIAATAGDTIGALLNISCGNLVELILFIALTNDQVRLVQASILGSILVNLLLILGSALVTSSMLNLEPIYNSVEAQLLACLLFVSVFVILMPTAFTYTLDGAAKHDGAVMHMSRISALMILLIYVIYFVHEIQSRRSNQKDWVSPNLDVENGRDNVTESTSRPSFHRQNSSEPHTLPPRTIRFADEGDADDTQMTSPYKLSSRTELEMTDSTRVEPNGEAVENRGRIRDTASLQSRPSSHQPLLRSHRHSRSLSINSHIDFRSRDSSLSDSRRSFSSAFQVLRDNRADMGQLVHEHDDTADNRVASIFVLIITSIIMSICAEFLVGTIDDVTHEGGLSESLIGLVILPIVGNVAEFVTVVAVAMRDKLDLAIAVSVGSAIQIALCVTPLTVMAGWALQKDLALTFNLFETATLLGSVLLANLLILTDGSSNLRTSGLKGALMCVCYVIIGLGAYFSP